MQRFRLPTLAGFGILVVAAALAARPALAAYPDKPIHIVVPFSPGGGTDVVARTLSVGMAEELHETFVVDNRPGAGTVIGSDAVAQSAPDGYTLLIATFAHAVNPSLRPRMPYDTDRAFAPVVLIARGPNVLVVRADAPYKSVQDMIAAAKANPLKLTYASQGTGTSAHLAGEMFANLAKVQMTHVPYRGAAPAITDLLGGQVSMMFGTAAAVTPLIQSGKLRALGVTSTTRSAAFKNVPAIDETVPGYAVESWYGLFVPAGTPADVVAKLNAAATQAAHSAEFAKRIQDEGLSISTGTPAQLEDFVHAEEARWKQVVTENHIKVD
ncbi:MAG: tripartite tricarboxylate transporter substrate binding protein [Burkholderiales bacterium]|nr:tripartite tricarboxylate transporter substrate binding protein [Burkholderiales bacterium]